MFPDLTLQMISDESGLLVSPDVPYVGHTPSNLWSWVIRAQDTLQGQALGYDLVSPQAIH